MLLFAAMDQNQLQRSEIFPKHLWWGFAFIFFPLFAGLAVAFTGMVESLIMGYWPFDFLYPLHPIPAVVFGLVFLALLVRLSLVVWDIWAGVMPLGILFTILLVGVLAADVAGVMVWKKARAPVPDILSLDDFIDAGDTLTIHDAWLVWDDANSDASHRDSLNLPALFRNDSFEIFGRPSQAWPLKLMKPWISADVNLIDTTRLFGKTYQTWLPPGFRDTSREFYSELIRFFVLQYPRYDMVVRKYIPDPQRPFDWNTPAWNPTYDDAEYLVIWHTYGFVPNQWNIVEDIQHTPRDVIERGWDVGIFRRFSLHKDLALLWWQSSPPDSTHRNDSLFVKWRGQPIDSVRLNWYNCFRNDEERSRWERQFMERLDAIDAKKNAQ